MTKKASRKSIIRALDCEMSLFVRERDRKCVLCGSTENLTNGHLFSRVAYSTRWAFDNCFCQCASCNLKHEYTPDVFTLWYIKKYGIKKYEDLAYRFHHTHKYTDSDLSVMLTVIQEKRALMKVVL
jgi:hypothetical protein